MQKFFSVLSLEAVNRAERKVRAKARAKAKRDLGRRFPTITSPKMVGSRRAVDAEFGWDCAMGRAKRYSARLKSSRIKKIGKNPRRSK